MVQHGAYCLHVCHGVKLLPYVMLYFSSVFASHVHERRLITVRDAMASNAKILIFIDICNNKQTCAKEKKLRDYARDKNIL